MFLLSAKHSKSISSHPQSLALLNDTQCAHLKGSFLDTKASLLNFTECFDLLDAEAIPGCRLLDSFPGCVFFYPCNCSSLCNCKTHLQSFDYLYLEAFSSSSTLVIVTDTSVIPSKHIQAVSAMYIWSLGQQILFSKASASRTTVSDAKLFIIRLGIAIATSIAIKCIILINNSLGFSRQAIDSSVHSGQAYSLAIYSVLRSFLFQDYNYKINFWDCLSKAEWSLY